VILVFQFKQYDSMVFKILIVTIYNFVTKR